jgi:hypothetical protein
MWKGWRQLELVVTRDSDDPLPKQQRYIVSYSTSKRMELTIWCEVNARHIIWSSTVKGSKGERIFEHLALTNTKIINTSKMSFSGFMQEGS